LKEIPGPVYVRKSQKETQRVSTLCAARTKRVFKGLFMEIQPGKVGDRAPEDFIYGTIFQGLKKDGPLMADLALKPPKDLHTFMVKMNRYIYQEETLRALLGNSQ
jgi:hypothetical protein